MSEIIATWNNPETAFQMGGIGLIFLFLFGLPILALIMGVI